MVTDICIFKEEDKNIFNKSMSDHSISVQMWNNS